MLLSNAVKPFEAERTTMTGKRKLGGSTLGAGGRTVTMTAGSNGTLTSPREPLSVENRAEPTGP